jgi:hypothetical protein
MRLLTYIVATSSVDSSTNTRPPEFANPTRNNATRRYLCSSRKATGACNQRLCRADALEEQVLEYVRAFTPPEVRKAIVKRLRDAARDGGAEGRERRNQLQSQLDRLRKLFVWGDLTENEYAYERQVLQRELETLDPPPVFDVATAAAALMNFSLFWEREGDPGERNRLLKVIFQRVSQDDGQLVSVTPREAFLPYFQFGQEAGWEIRERRG